ncbi:NmrA family transcriptional regulator, partial [Streptomyces sp. T-3]|nr:NmrA family transcriptional regulator [Streptomyces sp. T-3]
AAVARADLAEAAAHVALDPAAHAGQVYELVGEVALGGAELASVIDGTYEPSTLAEARAALSAGGGLKDFQVPMVVGTYSAIAGGFMDGTAVAPGALRTLLGREPRPALDAYREALA